MADTKVVITGDSSGAVAAVKRLNTELGSMNSMAAKVMSTPLFGGAGLFAGASVAGLVSITKAAIDTGDMLNKMAQKTGMSVEELSKLTYAADLADVSTEALQKGLTALSVGMVEASTGAGPMAEKYRELGISVRNADGTMKSSRQVLGELADKFANMPDGVDKTNLAVDIFGKKLGADMIPLLNAGAAGLKAMGDEAERLGQVMSAEMAAKAEEFNDNLERMSKLSKAAGIEVGNTLLPALNRSVSTFLNLKKAGYGWGDYLSGLTGPGGLQSSVEKIVKAYQLAGEEIATDAQSTAGKREAIERQLQTKLAQLAQLRAVAEGEVSAEILQTDEKTTSARIANAQKLQQKFQQMWKEYSSQAATAGAEAQKLLEQAANTRQTGADKADAKRRSGMSEQDQQADIRRKFDDAAGSADQATSLAKLAASQGRSENADKLLKQAIKDAERAANLADQINDPEAGAQAIEKATQIQAQLQEAQAQQKQQDQAQYQAAADSAKQNVDSLSASIDQLQKKAAAIKVEADIAAAQGAIATLKAQLDSLQDKTVNVTVNTTSASGVDAASALPSTAGFAAGGYTGPGGKWEPAGIVHAGEYVLRQEVVRQRGALEFLSRFNRVGLAALQGYASGGLVSRLAIPSLPSTPAKSSASAVFNFPGMGSYPVSMSQDVMGELTNAFQRAALKRGGRR